MEDATRDEILTRMLKVIGCTTDVPLTRTLNVSSQAISEARRKERVPAAWAIKLDSECQVSLTIPPRCIQFCAKV